MNASRIVTVKLKAVPAVATDGAVTLRCVPTAALTAIVFEAPVIDAVTVSLAVSAWLPAVFSVADKALTPLVSVEFAGNDACPSILIKCTVPA